MKLLSAEQVKEEKDARQEEQRRRTKRINDAESEAVRRLNAAKEQEKAEKLRLSQSEAERNAAAQVKKTVLEIEVEQLESRKAEALAPINAQIKEAQKLKDEAEAAIALASQRRADLDKAWENFEERLDAIADREAKNEEASNALDRREAGVAAAEEEIGRSTKALSQKWVTYYEACKSLEVKEQMISKLEKDVQAGTRSNELVAEANKAEADRLQKEKRALKDSYIALEKAKEHLGIK